MNRDVFFNTESNNSFISQIQNNENEDNSFVFYTIFENDSVLGSFIGGKNKNGKNIKFILSVEENQFYIRGNNSYNSVLNYKQELFKSEIGQIENRFNSFVSIKNNKQKIHNLLVQKKNQYNNLVDTLEYDYNFNISLLNRNRFENIVFEESKKNEGFYFNNISNYFIQNASNYVNITGSFNSQSEFKLSKIEKNKTKENIINVSTSDTMRNNLIGLENKIYDINTCNDIAVQVLINLSRSFYTLSNNSFLGNYSENNSTKIVNEYNFERYRVLTSDRINSNVLQFINPFSDTLDVSSLVSDNNYKNISLERQSQILYLTRTVVQNFSNSSSFYLTLNTEMNFLNSFKNFYMNDKWSDFTTNNIIFDSDDNISGFTDEQNLEVDLVRSLNKIFNVSENSNLFSVRWNYEDGIRNAIWRLQGKYHDLIENDEVDNTNQYSALKKFKEILLLQDESRLKLIFLNDKPVLNVNIDQGNVSFTEKLLIDKNENLNDFNYKVKIDNLVKSLKRKHFKNKEINLDLFKNLITKAKLYNFNKMVAYSNNSNTENIVSLVNKDSLSFKFLFSEDSENDEVIYSNTDIYTNHNINNTNILGVKNRIENESSKSTEYNSIKDNLKKIINNYYTKNYFFSTSSLYNKILQDVALSIDTFYNDRNINVKNCNAFYLNKFTSENISETNNNIKRVIARRFLKKALFMCDKTPALLNKSKLSDYLYDYESYDVNDYKQESQDGQNEFFSISGLERYLNAILRSSPNLKIIKDSVYSLENINSIKSGNDYTGISSINIYESDVWLSLPNEAKEILIQGAIQKTNIFPFYSYTSRFETFRSINQDVKFKTDIKKKNSIKAEIFDSGSFGTLPTGNYYLDKENLDITNSKDIKIRYYIERELLKNEFLPPDERRKNDRKDFNNYIEVTDLFDKNSEEANLLFNNICKVIIESLNLYSKEFSDASFILSSEQDIDNFISRNVSFLENEVYNIINLYSDVYMTLYKRALRYSSFYEISQNNFSYNTDLNIQELPLFGRVNKININGNIPNITADIWNLNNNFYSDFKESSSASDIIRSNESFSVEPGEIISSSFSKKLNNIQKSLFRSDFYQSYMLDLLNGFIFHQEKIDNLEEEEINYKFSDKSAYEIMLSEANIDFIKNNFFNSYYFSNLSKNLFENTYKNSKVVNNILDNFESQSLESYSSSFFSTIEEIKDKEFEKARNVRFSNVNLSDYYVNSLEDLDRESSIYMFGLRNKDISNISENNLIKFTINIVDKLNLNHVYLPNILYFSPNLFEVNHIQDNELINVDANASLGFYTSFENLQDKKKVVNIQDLLNQDQLNIKNTIRQKISKEEEEVDLIYQYLIKCHVRNKNAKMYSNFMLDVKEESDNENKDFKELIENSLSNKEFYNIFNKQKKYINDINFDDSFEKLSFYLDSIFNLEKSFKDFYELFFVSIDPKKFLFYDLSNEDSSRFLNVEIISEEYLTIIKNEINSNFDLSKIKQHSDNSYLNNISIDIKVEII